QRRRCAAAIAAIGGALRRPRRGEVRVKVIRGCERRQGKCTGKGKGEGERPQIHSRGRVWYDAAPFQGRWMCDDGSWLWRSSRAPRRSPAAVRATPTANATRTAGAASTAC